MCVCEKNKRKKEKKSNEQKGLQVKNGKRHTMKILKKTAIQIKI